eukprot:Lankesteria_metandrocarpae@DN8181_c0_g1_i1.p1
MGDDVVNVESSEGLDVKFRFTVLADLVVCTLCRGFFRDATTIRECLHTFCRSCILYYYKLGGRCCPICKEQLQTSRFKDSIQSDVNIQNLIDKTLPHFRSHEIVEECALAEYLEEVVPEFGYIGIVNGSLDSNALTSRVESRLTTDCSTNDVVEETLGDVRRPTIGIGTDATVELCQDLLPNGLISADYFSTLVRLVPAKNSLPDLLKPCIWVNPRMTVLHLKRYVAGKLRLAADDFHKLELIFANSILPSPHSIEFVCRSRRLDPNEGVYTWQYDVSGGYKPLTTEEMRLWKALMGS